MGEGGARCIASSVVGDRRGDGFHRGGDDGSGVEALAERRGDIPGVDDGVEELGLDEDGDGQRPRRVQLDLDDLGREVGAGERVNELVHRIGTTTQG